MPNEIDVINKMIVGSFFILGMLVGASITIFITDYLESKRRE